MNIRGDGGTSKAGTRPPRRVPLLALLAAIVAMAAMGHVFAQQSTYTGAPSATGQFNSLLPTLGSGSYAPLQLDSNGRLLTNGGGAAQPITFPAGDPCANPGTAKSSTAVNVSSATTTQLVALSGSKVVYVCGGYLAVASSATTAATAGFEYGTGTSCGTGTTALTGTVGTGQASSSLGAQPFLLPSGSTDFATASGNALCLVTAGTTVSVQGYIAYVQQ